MKEVIIFDDFYSNPYEVRETALKAEYTNTGNYPGKNSANQYYDEKMLDFFCYLAGEKIKPSENTNVGCFRTQVAGESGKQLIHVDLPSLDTTWSAVCYLSLPKDYTKEDGSFLDCGTNFWKHKKTGMEKLPRDINYLESIGLYTPNHLFNFMNEEGIDESLWIKTFTVPFKFNRLVMFRSNLWHSQAELFGDNIENGRLIQTFFFEPVNE